MSALPSAEELQHLLDAATPGYWIKGVEMRTGEITIATTDMDADRLTVLDTSNCTEENASLVALAPVLAAEVIRLREEIKSLREHYRELEKGYDDASVPFSPGRWFSHNAIQDLTRILEGDQA